MNEQADHPDIEKLPLEIDGIPVRETIREIFRNPENGTPDNISKAGCLALALKSNEVGGRDKGHVVWNAWREVLPTRWEMSQPTGLRHASHTYWANAVDFSSLDQSNDPHIPHQFSKFKFGDGANFSHSTWSRDLDLRHAVWGDNANFEQTDFGVWPNLRGAQWGHHANFHRTKFDHNVQFHDAAFGDSADFSESDWPGGANFRNVSFGHRINFSKSIWGGSAYFGVDPGLKCSTHQIEFDGAEFRQDVKFSGRTFSGTTSFSGTKFKHAPIFHGCELHPDTSIEDAVFPPDIGAAEGSKEAARAYRTLKLAFSKQQAIRGEQRFFRLEMEEETLRETGLKRGLFRAYKWFSDYGFSVMRPFLLLVAAWLAFATIYGHSSGHEVCWVWGTGCELRCDWLGYSLRQALPLLSFDKPDHTTALAIQGVSIGWLFLHKTISLAALFLIGLALRNLFKLK